MADDLVDQIQPGLYLGPQRDPSAEAGATASVARIEVTALPGNTGVVFDYEVLSAERGRGHAEHTVMARASDGLVLFCAHSHAPTVALLRETDPGYFVPDEGSSPFPMAIRIEAPDPSRIIYSWSYGEPGAELVVRDIGDVRIVAT